MLNIQNSITSQGTSSDVEKNFTIDDLIEPKYTPSALRLVVEDDSYCYKVVSYYPQAMGNVDFDVKINYLKRSKNEKTTITQINNNLHALIPWFVEAQTQANIVGKAYLVLDANNALDSDYFSLAKPIENSVYNLRGVKVFGVDEVFHTDDDMYVTKRYSQDAIIAAKILTETDVEQWISKQENLPPLQKDKIKFNVIHKSHILEFTAFDYQDNREALQIAKRRVYIDNHRDRLDKYEGISFRLIRFIRACLRFSSFINSVVNRMARSEAIIYQKENLGEINQAIARLVASTSDNNLKPNVEEIIREELTAIRDSMRNFGVTLIDKKNELQMLSRSFAGIGQISDVFYRDLISASALTEYGLFGVTSSGSGLAGEDERDAREKAKNTDDLFSNHWIPLLTWVANLIGRSYGLNPDKHFIYIDFLPSYKMSSEKRVELVSKHVDTLIKLLDKNIIDKQVILNEISGNGIIGKHFAINELDSERLMQNDPNNAV